MANPLNKPYNPRVICMGVGQRMNCYRLLDFHAEYHFVQARNIGAAQAILRKMDAQYRAAHKA
jgi:hypothetical protein